MITKDDFEYVKGQNWQRKYHISTEISSKFNNHDYNRKTASSLMAYISPRSQKPIGKVVHSTVLIKVRDHGLLKIKGKMRNA